MLETLTIKNFGIIEQVSLELSDGLSILTGETGAGKSILIDALRFGLGERFQASHLRDGADICTVEAVFALSPAFRKTFPDLEDFPSEGNELVIQRSVTADGKNRSRINGLTATVAQLKSIGDRLVDLHGPHDHQQLLAEDQHIGIIDALTDLADLNKEYTALYKEYTDTRRQLTALNDMALSRERDLDLLGHQIRELEQVPLDETSYAQIEADRVKINNAEKLYSHVIEAIDCLENETGGAEIALSKAFKPLHQLTRIDDSATVLQTDLERIHNDTRTLLSSLQDYAGSLSFDADSAKAVNARYDACEEIKRKYGPSWDDARRFYEDARKKFALLSDMEHNTSTLQNALKDAENGLLRIGKAISQKRAKTALRLKKTIEEELQALGFKSVTFEARLQKKDIAADGIDHAVFFISTNAGESLKPLAEIVSSGEAARLMLAIKRALMEVDPVPVLIFDEIDAQIGGRLGTVIGQKLKEIAGHRQVILITHLPQIAAFADTHFKITKVVENNRTRTVVAPVKGQARVEELAHMMSGEHLTPIALKHAQDLLKKKILPAA